MNMKRVGIVVSLVLCSLTTATGHACSAGSSMPGYSSLGVVALPSTLKKIAEVIWRSCELGKPGLGVCRHALPDSEIKRLAQTATKPNGLKEVGLALAALKLPEKYGADGHLALLDTYLRIGVKNNRLSNPMAEEVIKSIPDTKGIAALIRKINSINDAQSKGHLRELEIALSAKNRNFKPVAFGERFRDAAKGGDTDLDVLVQKGNFYYAIESKAYANAVPADMVRKDAESLLVYCSERQNTIPIFCFENPPSQPSRSYLVQKGIKCLTGSPDDIAAQLDILSVSK